MVTYHGTIYYIFIECQSSASHQTIMPVYSSIKHIVHALIEILLYLFVLMSPERLNCRFH